MALADLQTSSYRSLAEASIMNEVREEMKEQQQTSNNNEEAKAAEP